MHKASSQIGNIKMLILPKLIYRFGAILIKSK